MRSHLDNVRAGKDRAKWELRLHDRIREVRKAGEVMHLRKGQREKKESERHRRKMMQEAPNPSPT